MTCTKKYYNMELLLNSTGCCASKRDIRCIVVNLRRNRVLPWGNTVVIVLASACYVIGITLGVFNL